MVNESVIDKKQYVLPLEPPIAALEFTSAFGGLSAKERLYAHHISEASWAGSLVTLVQTSPESGPIFVLLHKLFGAQTPEDFKEAALKAGIAENDVKALFSYTCGVYANAGNYKGFGDTKFIPSIDANRFEELLKCSKIYSELAPLWGEVKNSIYDLSGNKTCLGYASQGITTYLSKNCTPEDNEKVQNWLKGHKIECYNTRLFKTVTNEGKIEYEIRLAAAENGEILKEEKDGAVYRITKGDYAPLMSKVGHHLSEAAKHTANSTQQDMLQAYVKSFTTGSLDEHKNGSRHWIRDKSPAVETYIGFIETYRDPAGARGEFEGFVAAVNREMSAKFTTLVANAEKFLPLLPWSKDFEKDHFLKPDFTSLDVLTFAGSGIPAGINIPNYDDIRQTEGFKNVSLGNVIPASYQMSKTPFLSESDAELLQKYRIPAFELQVGLHELLGHGSGKLLRRETNNTLNFPSTLTDPLTGQVITACYEPGDTYDVKFGPLSSTYEECRAEAVGLYLSLEPSVLEIFGHIGPDSDDVIYVNWLSLVWAGAGKGLEMWEPGRGWLQAHSQARYVIAQVLMEAGVVKVTQPTENDLLVTLDRSAIKTTGREAIGNFLLKLQIYKSTGNVAAAEKMYNKYSEVSEPWLSWRSIVMNNKQPRKMFVQSNTVLDESKSVVRLVNYDASVEGLIQSWSERLKDVDFYYEALLSLAKKDAHHF